MSNNINMVIELSEYDRNLLKDILAELAKYTGSLPAEPTPVEPVPAEPEQKPTVTMSQVQKKVVELSAAGKKPEVRTIVQKYAAKVSLIAPEQLPDVMAELEALDG